MAHRRADARPTRTVDVVPPAGGTAADVESGTSPSGTGPFDTGPFDTERADPVEDTERAEPAQDESEEDAERIDAMPGGSPPLAALRLDRILAAEDDPRGWGGRGDDAAPDHDRWLREQRPPHWS